MGDDLIDTYVEELRTALRWRSDADDIVAEAEDHLREAAAGLETDGGDPDRAQAAAIAEFGQPLLVARAHAVGAGHRPAVPTSATRVAGMAALLAAALWVAVPVLWLSSGLVEESTGDWTGTPQLLGAIGAMCLLAAAALTTVTAIGLVARHGGLGASGIVGPVLMGLGTVMTFVGWFLAGWMTLGGIGLAVLAMAIHRRGLAPRWPTILLGSGLLIGLAAFLGTRALELGSPDEWGDYRAPQVIGLVLGSVVISAGLLGTGRWLASEEPAPSGVLATR